MEPSKLKSAFPAANPRSTTSRQVDVPASASTEVSSKIL